MPVSQSDVSISVASVRHCGSWRTTTVSPGWKPGTAGAVAATMRSTSRAYRSISSTSGDCLASRSEAASMQVTMPTREWVERKPSLRSATGAIKAWARWCRPAAMAVGPSALTVRSRTFAASDPTAVVRAPATSGLSAPALNNHTSKSAQLSWARTNSMGVWTKVRPSPSVERHRAKYSAMIADPPEPTAIAGRAAPSRSAEATASTGPAAPMRTVEARVASLSAKIVIPSLLAGNSDRSIFRLKRLPGRDGAAVRPGPTL